MHTAHVYLGDQIRSIGMIELGVVADHHLVQVPGIIIMITRPKPAYGRQGLAGSWGLDTDEVSTFLVFLTSHFAPAALSSDLNQPGTINDNNNPSRMMKTRPGAIKTDLEQ